MSNKLESNIIIDNMIKQLINKNQMSKKEYEYITINAKNKKMLVFGAGNDTNLWNSISKYAIFLENDPKWIQKCDNIHLIEYTCKIENYKQIFENLQNGNDEDLLIDLPYSVRDCWDVILVDSPTGYSIGQHGRMQSIYAAYLLANSNTDIFIHDYDRDIEKLYSDYLFKSKINLVDKLLHVRK